MNDIVTLITRICKNADVYEEKQEQARIDVFAKVNSVSQSEFYAAGQAGIKPELKVTIWKHEYEGQVEFEYQGKGYSIYRTYETGEYIELIARRSDML